MATLVPGRISAPGGDILTTRLASCDKAQNFNTSNHSLDGVYSMTTDGSKVRRLTVNPFPPALPFGGGDSVGDVSPDGRRYVFMRAPTAEVGAGLL